MCHYCRVIMKRELFAANEILQRCLLYIRNQCESASSSLTGKGTGDKAISLIRVDPHMVITLDGFCRLQAEQCDAAFLQLSRIREKVMKLAWECCAVSLWLVRGEKIMEIVLLGPFYSLGVHEMKGTITLLKGLF